MSEDILKQLRDAGFKPVATEDDGGFGMITGKYVMRIEGAGRMTGKSKRTGADYDFRTLKMQVCQILEGDKATNRFLDKSYNPDAEGTKRLLNDLHTAGIEITAESDEELDQALTELKDKTLNVRCWIWKNRTDRKTGEPIPDIQMIKIVKEFAGSKKPDKVKSNVPF